MLLIFLIFNLFLHIILFVWYKIENTTIVYRLALISLFFAFFYSIYDTYVFSNELTITFFNDNLRLNKAILVQESIIIFLALILLIVYRDFKFRPEFFLIFFTNLLSATFLLESYNFIIFFISWELFNLSLYTMIIGNGIKKQGALAASMKYFLLSAFSTAFLLLALAILYHITGSLEFEAIYMAMPYNNIDLPVTLIIFALLFKMGAAPLHFWAPDLYDATPLSITAFISNLPKLVYIFISINLMDFLISQSNLFLIAGLLSLIVGTVGLTQQFKVKRFLAFSAITNIGYFLLIIKFSGLVLYNIVLYILPIINIFIILISANQYYDKEIDNFIDLKGFFRINPFMALSFAISIFSIAGIPPLPGFFAKYNLLITSFQVFHPIIFAILIITTVIAVANYLRFIYLILFTNSTYTILIKSSGEESENHISNTLILFNFLIMGLLTYLDLLTIILNSLGYNL